MLYVGPYGNTEMKCVLPSSFIKTVRSIILLIVFVFIYLLGHMDKRIKEAAVARRTDCYPSEDISETQMTITW